MSEINKINLNDTLYDLEDTVARGDISTMQANVANDLDACTLVAEEDKTLAGAYAVQQLNRNLANINVYVDDDKKLHFVDKDGADTVLPFSSGMESIRWSLITSANEHMNINNTGQLKFKTLTHSGANNIINIYGTNDPTDVTHGTNLITSCTITFDLETTLDTGNEYEYLVLYNLYQSSGGQAVVEISQ